jgi:hypothetical protein
METEKWRQGHGHGHEKICILIIPRSSVRNQQK